MCKATNCEFVVSIISIIISTLTLIIAVVTVIIQNRLTRNTTIYQTKISQFDDIRKAVGEYMLTIDPNVFVDIVNCAKQDNPAKALNLLNSHYDKVTSYNANLELYLFEFRLRYKLVDDFMDDRANVSMNFTQAMDMMQIMLTIMRNPESAGVWSARNVYSILKKDEYHVPKEVLHEIQNSEVLSYNDFSRLLEKSVSIQIEEMNNCFAEYGGIVRYILFTSREFIIDLHNCIDDEYRRCRYVNRNTPKCIMDQKDRYSLM